METMDELTNENAHKDRERKLVEIELNGVLKRIVRGEYTGRTLKLELGVPVEHELDLVAKGEFVPIANEDKVVVRGGEKYVSHCGQGQSA